MMSEKSNNNSENIFLDVKFIFYTLMKKDHKKRYDKYLSEKEYDKLSEECGSFIDKLKTLEHLKLKKWIEIKIGDYFEIVIDYTKYDKKAKDRIYSLMSDSTCNFGIHIYIDNNS